MKHDFESQFLTHKTNQKEKHSSLTQNSRLTIHMQQAAIEKIKKKNQTIKHNREINTDNKQPYP